jgi:hypothetical protein
VTPCRAAVAGFGLLLLGPASAGATPGAAEVRAQLAGLRLPFIANQGQVDAKVAYYAPTFAGTVFVTRQGELVYSLPARATGLPGGRPRSAANAGWSLTETLVDGRARPAARERSETNVSYFRGDDPARWRPRIPTYERVSLGEVWPGVTMSLRAQGRSVEKIFTIEPGTSVDRIRVRMRGARSLTVNTQGALVARTGVGDVTFTPPAAYQERDGVREPITVAYRQGGREYGFRVGAYDRSRPLVIDPLLQSTYLGGGGIDDAYALVVSPDTGNVYVTGGTSSDTFPGTVGGPQERLAGAFDAFVARLNGSLTAVLQATYLGGSDFDTAYTIGIAPGTGDVYVAGDTSSGDFPGTGGGAQPTYGGGSSDTFVARLSSGLTTLIQATYLGGADRDEAYGLAVAQTGHVYVVGYTRSTNFPATSGGAQPSYNGGTTDGFVARLDGGLTALSQSTYLGGSQTDHANALAISPASGDVYVAGDTTSTNFPGTSGAAQPSNAGNQDAFVARLTSGLTTIVGATYLGGTQDDVTNAIALAPGGSGNVYVAGYTHSTDFPATGGSAAQPANAGGYDAVVALLNGALTSITRATYLGGADDDAAFTLAVSPATGDVYVAGATMSSPFPATSGGIQPTIGGLIDAFVARLNSALTGISQSTYLGGSDDDAAFGLAISPATGDVYLAGGTQSTNVPGTPGGAQPAFGGVEDAFVAWLSANLAAGSAATFVDVPTSHPFFMWIEALVHAGITGGCATNPAMYCPDDQVTRAQMAVFLLRGIHGGGYQPAAATGTMFADVAASLPLASWIEQLAREAITGGCATSPPQYCPAAAVTRGQMAVFLLRSIHGADYQPPAATGTFADVPTTYIFAPWIEQLAREGITAGCATNPARYCPEDPVTRGQMAVFLVRAFQLPL